MPRLYRAAVCCSGGPSRAYSSNASRLAATASSSRAVPLSRSPSSLSATPMLYLNHDPIALPCPRASTPSAPRDRRRPPFERRRAALPLAKRLKRCAEIVLRYQPIDGTRSRVRFLQRLAIGPAASSSFCVPLSRCRGAASALPRLPWLSPTCAAPARASFPSAPRERPRRFFHLCCVLALPKVLNRAIAEIVLRRGPLQRHALARPFL